MTQEELGKKIEEIQEYGFEDVIERASLVSLINQYVDQERIRYGEWLMGEEIEIGHKYDSCLQCIRWSAVEKFRAELRQRNKGEGE